MKKVNKAFGMKGMTFLLVCSSVGLFGMGLSTEGHSEKVHAQSLSHDLQKLSNENQIRSTSGSLYDLESSTSKKAKGKERSDDNDALSQSPQTISSSSLGDLEAGVLIDPKEKHEMEEQIRQLLNKAYIAQDKKQHRFILWGRGITTTAIVVVAVEILLNILEAAGIGIGAYFACK